MESYEFELFAFWDDLEYADDPYWDYGLARKEPSSPGKRKRDVVGKKEIVDKRRRKELQYSREDDPLLFVSRAERIEAFFQPPPLLESPVKYTFLADWRERFAGVDGEVLLESKDMPMEMKRAAEEAGEDMDEDEEQEGDWEDEDGEDDMDEEDGDGPVLDPDMLKEILKQKLGDAGLGGEDEAAFMQVIAKMMSGDDSADELTGNLANSLLGKLTSGSGEGDPALSGWLSQQGVSLDDGEDDDASSVATLDLPEGLRHTGVNTRQNAQDSPIDSVVGEKRSSTQMPLHSGSPTSSSTKKRAAPPIEETEKLSKKQKKVTFDVPPTSSFPEDLSTQTTSSEGVADVPTSEDPLTSESTLSQRPTRSRSKKDDPTTDKVGGETASKTPTTRKRKAVEEVVDDKPPEKKKTRKKEVDLLENATIESPMGPPARRTRAARAKGGK